MATVTRESEISDRSGASAPLNSRIGISLKAWIVGLLLIPVLIYWLEYTEIVASGPDMAAMSIPIAVLSALLVLIPINLMVKRISPKNALTQADLMAIFSMNTIAVYIGGLGFVQFLHPPLVGYRYYATSENHWDRWAHFVKPWAVPDASVVDDYYNGHTSFFTPAHIAGWAGPIAIWTGFIVVLLFVMYCISTIMRRQWVDNERLMFPIVQIPLEITRDGGNTPLWRSKIFWFGALLPVVLETIAFFHFTVAPGMPYLPVKPEANTELGHLITNGPWSAVGYTAVAIYPFVIGLTYLLALDVSFSCWFFYLVSKLEAVTCTALGFRDPAAGSSLAQLPNINEQGLGAFIAIALYSLYLGRRHIAATARKAFTGKSFVDDTNEPMSFRLAWAGLILGGVLLIAFGVAIGLSPLISCLFFGLFFLLALTFTRIRAEAGLPWGQGPGGHAHVSMVSIAGTTAFTSQELVGFSFLQWFDSDWRTMPQAAQIEAMKIADSTDGRPMNARQMTAAVMVASVVAALCAWFISLGIYYHYGAASASLDQWRTGQGHYTFDQLQDWLQNPKGLDQTKLIATGVGLGITLILSALRTRFVWWPLHPIGYAVGHTDTMTWIWMPMMIGWFLKSIILRFGGAKMFREALPFFFGLVIGDYAISGIMALFCVLTGHAGYRTFPI